MSNKIINAYTSIPLVARMLGALAIGLPIGLAISFYAPDLINVISAYLSPFGTVLVNMLKMIVIPIIFFSLISGAASIPLGKLGRVGIKTILWYLMTSLFASLFGVLVAMLFNPGVGFTPQEVASSVTQVGVQPSADIIGILLGMFANPFASLAQGNFLPIIVFAILFGVATRLVADKPLDEEESKRAFSLIDFAKAVNASMFKIVNWVMEYAPIGVLALTIVNFGTYGSDLLGSYGQIVIGIVLGIIGLIAFVYSGLLVLIGRENPLKIFNKIKEAMVTAFATRSSAATLPVSMEVARDELGVKEELASFTLPLGATINMDGVCIHLPMWAFFAANMFGIPMTIDSILVMVITTVLASIGAGGVPGGSLMLLFIILGTMGLAPEQIAIVVSLAIAVNPILDMFETMNNITGDLVMTYLVGKTEGLVDENVQKKL
ncbi:dicarboxylate/amino acid:cation symporter [Methanococcus voltae]|uniref:Na+/H+-dicarboxylate symporter n=1 Tax=Methanococcus voltae TaxID=2188 RepID=A0A8J7UTV0_METVO|nr:dicarboxylate/amino acid:cation symporter [Methanococcus voltae]MBP2173149.1 Na+/H+-dicarboxylate symporter [Methanococcus voltae]MBP2202059.1 Na+/H+-dicarboxylate symporter [Methanococcus voltae]